KSMGEYIGEVKWCNSVQMEIAMPVETRHGTSLHNGDGLCFLNQDEELIGIRADVVRPGRDSGRHVSTVVCNRPHGAFRGARIYRNYDIEWQRQVEASKGNRKIDIDLVLTDLEDGFELSGKLKVESGKFSIISASLSTFHSPLSTPKIVATNPEKALENIRKKLSQWGDTIYNPININIRLSQPFLIPASVLGELKRGLLAKMVNESCHCERNEVERGNPVLLENDLGNTGLPRRYGYLPSVGEPFRGSRNDVADTCAPDEIPTHLMTCHHCIRYANGMCPKVTGKPTGPLYIRNGENIFPLEFDCKNCLMYVCKPE
nr:DUF3656 domain-containing protein [Bacteroidales bacterium]